MNIYIGNSLEEITKQNYNIEFSDELLHYLYINRNKISIDMSALFEINPYSDSILKYQNIIKIQNICERLTNIETAEIFQSYEYGYDEAFDSVDGLRNMAKKALSENKCLIFIGD
ncbi:MAG: hypothetical protein NC177_10175 [Ruminococcus flavefaciens]|nr:hypothetical protein [Ruminococcus flavefaciens]